MEYVQRYTIEEGRHEAFQNWLAENAERLRDDSPDDWRYLGTFFVVHGTAGYDCESRWSIDGYASLDPDRSPRGSTWRQLIQEFQAFVSRLPPLRTVMLKEASDVTILGEEG